VSSALSPQVVAVVATLLLFRTLSTNVDELLKVIRTEQFGEWSLHCLLAYGHLLLGVLPMLLGISLATALGPPQGPRRIATLAVTVILSTGVGLLLRFGLGGDGDHSHLWGAVAYLWPFYALLGGMLTVAWDFYRREIACIETLVQVELDRLVLEREMAEARLRVMQAQIEPHFLFNTLANVRELVDAGSPQASSVLASLIAYLRAAVPRLHETETTLGQELELVRAYLEVMHMRMPDRLQFTLQADDAARVLFCPPMTLLTLVENAVRHGIDPSEEGGRIEVRVRLQDGRCHAEVIDTGVGLGRTADGLGTGLSNLRERLKLAFGGDAKVYVVALEPHGVRAELDFPAKRSSA
jgi:hypothetical protein